MGITEEQLVVQPAGIKTHAALKSARECISIRPAGEPAKVAFFFGYLF